MAWSWAYWRAAHGGPSNLLLGRARRSWPGCVIAAVLAGALMAIPLPGSGSPSAWPPGGVPIAATADLEFSPNIVPDGSGGVFIAWIRYGAADRAIYALAIDADGNLRPGWPPGGLLIPEVSGGTDPYMVADGSGGAFITSTSFGAVSLGHITPVDAGPAPGSQPEIAEATTGRALDPARSLQAMHNGDMLSVVIPDGAGGAFVSYTDNQRFYDTGYVRHYAADGSYAALSLSDITGCGNYICFLRTPTLCPDGAGGALVAWSQGCGARVLRLTPQITAAPGWPNTGVPAEACPISSAYVGICPDGAGGAYIAWQGYPTYDHPLHIQHLTGSGTPAPGWPDTTGLVLSPHPTLPGFARPYSGAFCSIVPDGFGGALVAWTDQRADTGDVYVQRISPDGIAAGWPQGGVAVGVAPGMQQNPVLVADGTGGAVVAWQDERKDPDLAIYANRVDAAGAIVPPGTEGGTLVSDGPGPRIVPRIASDGGQGAFIAWVDYRAGNADIYASHFPAGLPAVAVPPAPVFELEGLRPNPSTGPITCRLTLGGVEDATLEVLDLAGRIWVRRPVGPLGPGSHEVTIRPPAGMASGVYFVRLAHHGETRVSRVCFLR